MYDLTVTWVVGTASGQWSVVSGPVVPTLSPDVGYIHRGPGLMVDTCCTLPIYRDICNMCWCWYVKSKGYSIVII